MYVESTIRPLCAMCGGDRITAQYGGWGSFAGMG